MFHNGVEAIGAFCKGKVVVSIYHMGRQVWQAVRSCFGSGGWINDAPWLNDEGWKNE